MRQNKGQQHAEVINPGIEETAEHMRLMYLHLRWAANHAKAVYEAIKPPGNEEIEDPNQLKLFNE